MQSVRLVSLFMLVNALLSVGISMTPAAQARHTPSHHGGQAAGNAQSRAAPQGNQKWSADPERGWVRGDDDAEVREHRSAGKRHDQGRGQAQGKGKKF
jgi:hypothetical protein